MPSALFRTPDVDLEDARVIADVRDMRTDLAAVLRAPRRWTGGLRRTTQARAIQGSNTIEGYEVTDQDAVAAVDNDEPLTADERTWAEIVAYRRVLTFVLRMAPDPDFKLDPITLRSLHFMLLEHDLSKDPGEYRRGPVYVRDESAGTTLYEGPDASMVPELVAALVSRVRPDGTDPMVNAAMAHLNLVMIHPFRDGNGRMARALQTMVMAQDHVLEPTFSSIEEWLGHNTDDYYRTLALTGRGSWHPENDAALWVKFNLRAHHMQAQTLQRRFAEAEQTWTALDAVLARHSLPERVADPLFDAVLGYRVRRPTYVKRAQIEERTASRDLNRLVAEGLLEPHGQTRGRYYLAGSELTALGEQMRSARARLADPYPWLAAELRSQAGR
jgi:Fic family protein